MRYPVMLSPSAAHEALHPDKEAATYAGCKEASETPMIVSHVASMSVADIAKADGGPLWFQLYPREDLEQNREPVESAQNAGAGAIVVTIDQQASFYDRGYHDRNLSLRPRRPTRYSGNAGRYRFSSTRLWYEWKLFDGLRTMVKVPMLAKGILTGEDAIIAIEHGIDGIIVSNHGGRTLDYTPSSLEVLPEIVGAVAGRVPVLIDSGIRRGSDVLKALALGADAGVLGARAEVGPRLVRSPGRGARARDRPRGIPRGHEALRNLEPGRDRSPACADRFPVSRFVHSRRRALANLAGLIAASPCLRAEQAPRPLGEPRGRKTPLDEFANVPEFEAMAQRALSEKAYARIAGGERSALERITFRPRMMVNTKGLDLSLEIFDQRMFAPILVGPASRQGDFHPKGELATAEGAAAAKATLVSGERSGTPFDATVGAAPGAWRQVFPDPDVGALIGRVERAAQAGAPAACLGLGAPRSADGPGNYGWNTLERLRNAAKLPLVLKGVMQPTDAAEAAERGLAGIIVSNYGSGRAEGQAEPLTALPPIAEAVAGRIPILVDGGFRRGSDFLKAIALGATAGLVCRPVLWGLAAYGQAGVQTVLEMLQTELAKDMVQVGAVNLAAIRREHIRVHSR